MDSSSTPAAAAAAPLTGVSVVIPCYNYAHYLPQAIDSALAQSYRPLEVVVVDDGSTDDTPAVVAGYGERIRCIRKANGGLPAARNTGIQAATYAFVAFLDADDRWAPEFLTTVMAAFAGAGEGCGLVATRAQAFGPDGTLRPRPCRDRAVRGTLRSRDIILRTRFSPSAVVTRRRVFEDCGFFDETLTSSEDRDMWIRIGSRFEMVLLPEALAFIRNHPSSMSKNADRMKLNTRRVIRKARSQRVVSPWAMGFWLKVLSYNQVQCAWMYHDQRRHLRAASEMAASLLTWPWFGRPSRLNEPVFFRVRALRRFLWEACHGRD